MSLGWKSCGGDGKVQAKVGRDESQRDARGDNGKIPKRSI